MTDIGRPVGRRVLMASEKPMMATSKFDTWKRLYPRDEIAFFYAPPMGCWSISVPRDLPLGLVPRISEPMWTRNHYADGMKPPKGARLAGELYEEVRWADLVVCGTDPDHAGVFNFWNTMRLAGVELSEDILWWKIRSVVPADLEETLLEGRTVMDPEFEAWRRIGEARRFFDYNYAINALPCFSKIFRDVGAPLKLNFISKFALQLLLKMTNEDLWLSDQEIFRLMKNWPGSGKYASQELGSAMSTGQIVEDLKATGLLSERYVAGKNINDGYCLFGPSRLALKVVERLHKGMEDPDLPARLDTWGQNWPESRPQMERYIRTVFGRQKRFL